MVSAPGIGSGLDINGLVQQLVAAERQPVANRINLAEVRTNTELSAVGKIKSALADFQDTLEVLKDIDNFQKRTVALSSEDFVSVTATSAAVKGSYEIEVQQLATAQKLSSIAMADPTTPKGTGLLTLSLGAESFSVSIVDGQNSLADIRDAINDATDNPGVLATIVNADDGARLVLTADATGTANQISSTVTGGDGWLTWIAYDPLAGSNPMVELAAAQDAIALIDGFTVTSSDNSLDGAVEGLDISLLDAEVGTTTRIDIDFDDAAANAALTAFVNAYNALAGVIDEVTAYDSETGVAGALLGDSIVRDIESALRRELSNVVGSPFTDPFTMLAEIGITTDLDGKLSIDSTLSADAIELDFDAVGRLFADADDGIAVRLDAIVSTMLESTGTISQREERLNSRLEDLTEQRERLDDRMLSVEERYFAQFSALDTLLAQFNSTSEYLTTQLAAIPTPQAPGSS